MNIRVASNWLPVVALALEPGRRWWISLPAVGAIRLFPGRGICGFVCCLLRADEVTDKPGITGPAGGVVSNVFVPTSTVQCLLSGHIPRFYVDATA